MALLQGVYDLIPSLDSRVPGQKSLRRVIVHTAKALDIGVRIIEDARTLGTLLVKLRRRVRRSPSKVAAMWPDWPQQGEDMHAAGGWFGCCSHVLHV